MLEQMAISSAASASSSGNVARHHAQAYGVPVLHQPGPGRPRQNRGPEPRCRALVAVDDQHVRGGGFRYTAVRGQEEGVVRAGAFRLEAGVDQLGAGGRLDTGDRGVGVAADGADDEPLAFLEGVGGGRA